MAIGYPSRAKDTLPVCGQSTEKVVDEVGKIAGGAKGQTLAVVAICNLAKFASANEGICDIGHFEVLVGGVADLAGDQIDAGDTVRERAQNAALVGGRGWIGVQEVVLGVVADAALGWGGTVCTAG